VGQAPQDIYDSNVRRHEKIFLAAAKRAGVETIHLHQYGRDHRRSTAPAAARTNSTDAKPRKEMIGHLQTLEMGWRTRSPNAAGKVLPVIVAMAHHAGRPLDWKQHQPESSSSDF